MRSSSDTPGVAATAPAGDDSLHVEVRDAAPHAPGPSLLPVVLVHGVLDSSRSFARLVRSIDSRRTVLSYDRRGYQRSRSPEPRPTDFESNVEDLLSVLCRLPELNEDEPPVPDQGGSAPDEGQLAARGPAGGNAGHLVATTDRSMRSGALVLGHSFGGVVALAAAGRRPELIAGVLAYEPPLSWLDWWQVAATKDGSPRLMPEPGEPPERFAERFVRAMIGDDRYTRLSWRVRRGLGEDGPAAAAELASLANAAPFDPSAIRQPVVIARGSGAGGRHILGTDWLATEIPGAELAVVPGAGHGAHISHPSELAALLESLARRVESGATLPLRTPDRPGHPGHLSAGRPSGIRPSGPVGSSDGEVVG